MEEKKITSLVFDEMIEIEEYRTKISVKPTEKLYAKLETIKTLSELQNFSEAFHLGFAPILTAGDALNPISCRALDFLSYKMFMNALFLHSIQLGQKRIRNSRK